MGRRERTRDCGASFDGASEASEQEPSWLLDGCWSCAGCPRGTIAGGQLTWHEGEVTPLLPAGPKAVRLRFFDARGERTVFYGELREGESLRWDDGEVWQRVRGEGSANCAPMPLEAHMGRRERTRDCRASFDGEWLCEGSRRGA